MEQRVTGKDFSPSAILRALWRRKFYLLVPIAIIAPATYFYAQKLPQKFRAKALVGSQSLLPGHEGLDPRVDAQAVSAENQLLAIREALFRPGVLNIAASEFDLRGSKSIADFKSNIQIQVDGPEAFYIGFESGDPEQAAVVANRLAGLFVESTSNIHGQIVQQQDSVLDAEVNRLRGQLNAQEEGLKEYEASASQELPERLATNLKQLETLHQEIQAKTDQITEGEARRSAIQDEMKTLENQGVLQGEPLPKTPAQTALDEAKLKLSQMRSVYTEQNPEVQSLERQIQQLQAAASAPAEPSVRAPSPAQMHYGQLQAELKSIEPRLTTYRQERNALTSQVQDYEHRINASPEYATGVSQRAKDAAMLRTRYETLYAQQQEAKLKQRADATASGFSFKILEPAETPTAPYSPHRSLILLAGFLGSVALGLAGVLIVERSDTTFETPEAFEEFAGLPVLSMIPEITRPVVVQKIKSNPLTAETPEDQFTPEQMRLFRRQRVPVLTDPQGLASQQYGLLALKAGQWLRQRGGQTLVVTSATGEEGKSVTSVNLAFALANVFQGKVVLVDSDMRLPQIHGRLGLKETKGFSDLLADPSIEVADCVSRVGNLDVIRGGPEPKSPVGLLASPRAAEVLARLRKEYEFVVLDSPPLVPIADAHILTGLADGLLLVVRARKTRPEAFRRAVESLGANNLIGVVLNDVEYSATPYAYAYRYYQRHYLGRS